MLGKLQIHCCIPNAGLLLSQAFTSGSYPSHIMDRVILGPLAESLALVIEQDTESAPKED